MSLPGKRVYEFGEFRLTVSARSLERNGAPIQLGSKAFEVLVCLVSHAGEVVTKDELLRTVWPESFVEEGNLPQHIFALRKALGDRAGYIITIPGRGYQFTEPVRDAAEHPDKPEHPATFLLQRTRERTRIVIEETSRDTLPGSAQSQAGMLYDQQPESVSDGVTLARTGTTILETTEAGPLEPRSTSQTRETPSPLALPDPRHPGAMRRGAVVLLGAAAILAVSLFAWFTRRDVAQNQRVVLAELDNRTGDSSFDVVLRNALEIDLDQSPFLDVMSQPEEMNTLRLMGRDPETPLVSAVAREVCERSNRQVLISGSVANLGKRYLLALEASECSSGRILAGAKSEASSKDQMLAALDSASARLRHELGESAASLERFQVPIAEATTSSLEALKQYSIGEYLLGRAGKEEDEVLPFFQRALELDPHFAMAAAAIATSYFTLGESQLAAPYYQQAFDLSGQVSEKERLYIRAHYYSDSIGDIRQGLQAYEMWAETYPRDWGAWLDIARDHSQLGQYDAAIAAAQRALALDASRGVAYAELARDLMHAGRYAEAEATAQRAALLGKDSDFLRVTEYETALLRNDGSASIRTTIHPSSLASQWNLLEVEALAAARSGRLHSAQQLFHSAYAAAISENLPEKAQSIQFEELQADVDCGQMSDARDALLRSRQPASNAPEYALLQAELGNSALAEHYLTSNAASRKSDTMFTYVEAPLMQAQIALNSARPQEAIAALEPASQFDFAGGYKTIAMRGESYLRAGQSEQAAAEFQRILDHPGVDPVSPLFPLAWLGLARAQAQANRFDQSRASYEAFFELWKQADASLPVLRTAHAEYAKLGASR